MDETFDAGTYVAQMEKVMGLAVDDDWREGVEANMAATARAAELVLAFPLEEEVEAAPVFVP
ncbi:DUF4089 domain-containing protein [Labrenzia sp. OB1]|uniref:DUF4089 domain-containing protein n=1 Tax=Labrenzia sp. OB1 TaxID=1561204 RepID=UPI0007B19956|nr:DUF4089 domain-containing protein [Labrenzia sp. OB1]KZM49433.1 hypothetical protein OA90_15245 [Labrenzia sp. OB1]